MEDFERMIKTKVSPDDPRMHSRIDLEARDVEEYNDIFGYNVARLSDSYLLNDTFLGDTRRKRLGEALTWVRRDLTDLYFGKSKDDSSTIVSLQYFLGERERGHQISPSYEETLWEVRVKAMKDKFAMMAGDLNDSLVFTSQENLPDEVLIALCQRHFEVMREPFDEFRKKLPELKSSFFDFFTDFVQKNNIDIDLDVVRRKVRNTGGALIDPLVASVRNYAGYHDSGLSTVHISANAAEKDRYSVFLHEMLHAVSGKTILEIKNTEEELFTDYEAQRSGLIFLGGIWRFKWLNEAVTEELTHKIRGKNDHVYQHERDLLSEVRKVGRLSPNLFYNAYFEDYNPALTEGERIPHWKKLWHAINDAFEPGFMVKLDEMFKSEGFEAAQVYVRSFKKK